MPTYLCHGFRWHRRGIRIFVIINNLEDAAPDWIVGRTSASLILDQFRIAFDFLPSRPLAAATPTEEEKTKTPHQDDDLSPPPSRVPATDDEVLMHDWSPVKLLEEYDLDEMTSASRPYAYVADHVVRVDLGANVAKEMAKYQSMAEEGSDGWFEKLRDKLQANEEIQWYVVVCADDERAVPEEELDDYDDDDGTVQEEVAEEKREEEEQEEEDQEEKLPPLPPPIKDYPFRLRQKQQAAPPRLVETTTHTDRPTPTRSGDKVGHVALPERHSPPPEFIADDQCKATSRQPGLRRKLSAKGLRRIFSKRGAR
ncbi:AorFlbE-like protein [Hirsutella rhossiliensis]|uniref:AorFlbE-like protein n=1 Tax=Hirsutella rhossiliensis TaxID=111463 RepID=A0A9P8N0Z7_9HYPO|nr:AorFlbE-like protein [Hirsutella rhossiliensis]KAH0964597.1 AorFlbE-like protein [Hirsutella rhossiliensis]